MNCKDKDFNCGKDKKKIKTPDTAILIFIIILVFSALTYVIPVGKFKTISHSYMNHNDERITKTVIDPKSFKLEKNKIGKPLINGVPVFNDKSGVGILNYMFEGLASGNKYGSAVGIVMFILIIGGSVGVILRTGAIETGILRAIELVKGKEIFIIPIIYLIFSLGGLSFGMCEECIAFSAVIVPITIALGYDSITAVLISYVAAQLAGSASPLNPFSTLIAQGIAGVPVLSGQGFRWFLWVLFTIIGMSFSLWYANKVKKDPKSSLAYESDKFFRDDIEETEKKHTKLNIGHILILINIFCILIWIVWGVIARGYGIPQIGTQFFIMGIISGLLGILFKLNDMDINDIPKYFKIGASDLIGAALVVGMAKGIIIILGGDNPTHPSVLNTILNYAGHALKHVTPIISAWLMFLFQTLTKFFIPSTSGQAALTIPLLTPLGAIIGVSKQIVVLAYQLTGFFAGIFPTDPALLGVLAVAKLDWAKWAKSQWKFQGFLFLLGSVVVILAFVFKYT